MLSIFYVLYDLYLCYPKFVFSVVFSTSDADFSRLKLCTFELRCFILIFNPITLYFEMGNGESGLRDQSTSGEIFSDFLLAQAVPMLRN